MTATGAAELDRLILHSAREANILPLTSRCDSHCVFCSHKNNPPGIRAFSVGVRSMEDITRTLAFLDPRRVITIGESATPIIEGEPFLHPQFKEVISLIRRAFPETPLEITTNGRRLSKEMVELLAATGKVFLNLSLNSASVRGRRLLMGDTREQSERTIAGVELLAESPVRFAGSVVAMPNVTGWDDIRETVAFLAANKAVAVHVITPAFASFAKRGVFPDEAEIYGQLRAFVDEVAAESPCPVLIEPSCVADLTPVVSGVLRDSPAWRAGIRRGDVFLAIDGRRPRCRVEAWNLLLPEGLVHAEVWRSGGGAGEAPGPGSRSGVGAELGSRAERITWTNEFEGASGITMEYDFDPVRAESLRETILSRPGRSVLLTSELGHAVVRAVLRLIGAGEDKAEAVMVKNRAFGGTIKAAGLLTVDDYLESYLAWRASAPSPAQIIVPVESFDFRGVDLKGRHFSELQRLTGMPVLVN